MFYRGTVALAPSLLSIRCQSEFTGRCANAGLCPRVPWGEHLKKTSSTFETISIDLRNPCTPHLTKSFAVSGDLAKNSMLLRALLHFEGLEAEKKAGTYGLSGLQRRAGGVRCHVGTSYKCVCERRVRTNEKQV